MKLFDIFDKNGKIGEIYETDADSGSSSFVKAFFWFIVIVGVICIWPIIFKLIFSGQLSSSQERMGVFLYLVIYFLTATIIVFAERKREHSSFLFTFVKIMILKTLVVGFIYWLLATLIEGYQFGFLFISLFLTFLLSVATSLICTLIVYKKKKDKWNRRLDYEKD